MFSIGSMAERITMNNQIKDVSGFFNVTGFSNKKRLIIGLIIFYIIYALTLIPYIFHNVLIMVFLDWSSAIFNSIIIMISIYIFKKKPRIKLLGFMINEQCIYKVVIKADAINIKELLVNRKNKINTQSNIIPLKCKSEYIIKEKLFINDKDDPIKIIITIAEQEPFQSDFIVDWHIREIEIYQSKLGKESMAISPNSFCVIKNNFATYHFSHDKRRGDKLLEQISMVGNELASIGISGSDMVTLKIIPPKSGFVGHAVFGAIGGLVKAIKDEVKKKNMKQNLKDGELTIISKEADKKLYSMIDMWQWDIVI